jgi:phosphate transport system substrate-binding protein
MIDPEENFYNNLDSIVKAIQTDRYPSPPARDLYFVAHGKPANPAAVAFLNWILSNGQQYVHEAGYVKLKEDKIIAEKLKLQ